MESGERAIAFERVELDKELPFRCFFNSIGYVGSHWHSELEIILQVRGEIIVSTRSGPFVLHPGDLFLSNPFETHSLVSQSADNLELALQIDLSDPMLLPRQIGTRRFAASARWSPVLRSTVQSHMISIADELAVRRDGYGFACLSATAGLIKELVRGASDTTVATQGNQDYPVWLDHVTLVIGYLREQFDHRISLESVAREVGLSRFYVSHLVKQATGMSLQENLALIRTNHAIHLMYTTDAKLVDIALDAGFSHLKYFNKYFMRLFGETPRTARTRTDWQQAIAKRGAGKARAPSPELVAELQGLGTRPPAAGLPRGSRLR